MVREVGRKPIATNRRARHDYTLHDRFEAGLVLSGTEVKSLRAGRASLAEAYVAVEAGEVWLINANIAQYSFGTWTNHAPRRKRKLLLHAKEIRKLQRETEAAGRTIVPLELYFRDGYAKVEIALASGKREWDKRQTIAQRDADREAQRALRARQRRSTS